MYKTPIEFFIHYFTGDSWWWVPCAIIIGSQLPIILRRHSVFSFAAFTIGWQLTCLFCVDQIFRIFHVIDVSNHNFLQQVKALIPITLLSVLGSIPAIFTIKLPDVELYHKGIKCAVTSVLLSIASILITLLLTLMTIEMMN